MAVQGDVALLGRVHGQDGLCIILPKILPPEALKRLQGRSYD